MNNTPTVILPTTDKRPRTSDGFVTCDCCEQTIPNGDRYQQVTVSGHRGTVEINTCTDCLDCLYGRDSGWLAVFTTAAAIVIILALSLAVFGG